MEAGDSPIGNAERLALDLRAMALDMHLNTDTGDVTTRARLTVRNGGASPLEHVALQVSSALVWQSARLLEANGAGMRLPLRQFRVTTDLDHTGAATELALTLPKPLAPGAELHLDLYYGGALQQSGERLLRLGAPADRAAAADWDTVSPDFTGLRGVGNVLWFPVAAPATLLADGPAFAAAVESERERTATTAMQLVLHVEHSGTAPLAAWFLDGRQDLEPALRHRSLVGRAAAETPAAAGAAEDGGAPDQTSIDTATWNAGTRNGRPVSLFIAPAPPPGAARTPTDTAASAPPPQTPANAAAGGFSSSADAAPAHFRASAGTPETNTLPAGSAPDLLLIGADPATAASYGAAADRVRPLLARWLPVHAAPLTVLSLPAPGTQAFADGGLLVAPLHPGDTAALAEALVYPMAAARAARRDRVAA